MRRRIDAQPTRRGDSGLSLLELTVAILVLSIGSIAALRATDQSGLAISGAQTRMLAQIAARNRAEELRLLGPRAGLPGEVTLGGQTFAMAQDIKATAGGFAEVTVTAKGQRGGALLVVFVPTSR